MTRFEEALALAALGLLLLIAWLVRYENQHRLSYSLCDDCGLSENGIPCPSCSER